MLFRAQKQKGCVEQAGEEQELDISTSSLKKSPRSVDLVALGAFKKKLKPKLRRSPAVMDLKKTGTGEIDLRTRTPVRYGKS